ncbi:flagellar hook-associated protein FlgK [Nitrospina gracilis]|nr:flagellar hook-associated protein FlgK [Nitrospina gracilis]
MGLIGALNTAKVSLLAQQLAIEVTGQNIANVQTEGYSRQQVNFEAVQPRTTERGQLGTGVQISGIERSYNKFLFSQIMGEVGALGEFGLRKDVFEQVEILFSESNGQSLNRSLGDFFSSLQDLSANPSGLPERSNVLAQAESLASTFKNLGETLLKIQRNLDAAIPVDVARINSLTSEIAKLNKTIHANEPAEFSANDLRDRRDLRVKELGKIIDLTVVDQMDGQLSLTLSDGTQLVNQITSFDISTVANGNNKGFRDVTILDLNGNTVNFTSLLKGGSLKGRLDMRDVELVNIKDKLDRLAAGFIQEFNNIHQQGFGVDGTTGNNFFATPSVMVEVNTNNTGSASLTATNGNPSAISIDKFEITVTGSNTFTLNNLTTGANEGTFSFTPGSTFNLAGGFAIAISAGAAVGDKFKLSISEDAAQTFSVSSEVASNSNKIAAGLNSGSDGGNILNLIDLQSKLTFDGITHISGGSGAFTFDEFYSSMVSNLGIQSFSTQATFSQQEGILLQLNNRRQSISGVSLDEEFINMIKFQQAFNAAARMISIIDELLDTVNQTI